MIPPLSIRIAPAAALGLIAAAGNLLGGYFVVRREWPRQFLQYFVAFGAGYMLAVAFVDVIPEAVRLGGDAAFLFVLAGFFLVHLFEHALAPHFHFGEEIHPEAMHLHGATSSVFLGLFVHTFFDGVAIAGGVPLYVAGTDLLPEVNREPGWRVALLVFLGAALVLALHYLFHL